MSCGKHRHVLIFDKDGNESVVTISYKIKFIESAKFIAASLSNVVDNLTYLVIKIIQTKLMKN